MPVKKAEARWNGNLKEGSGTMKVESGTCEGKYSFATRFEDKEGTNPEELIGAAHAGCYSMALSNELAGAGYEPKSVETTAEVTFEVTDEGPAITEIQLITKGSIPKIDEDTFQKIAEGAKEGCPVSKALAGTHIKLKATLV